MKIAIIGGGSTYTPELVEGLVERGRDLGLTEVVLEDIDADRLDPVSDFCRRMVQHKDGGFRVRSTMDLDEAVKDCTFVVTQIRVGGQEARYRDETRGRKLGLIGQETTGEGGFCKAVRTIPEILDIAARVRHCAPGAWIINFTNPSGIITEALLRHGRVQTVGLCNIPIEMKMEAAKALGLSPESVELDYVGLNHLGWVRGIRVNGKDIMDDVLALFTAGGGLEEIPELDFGADFYRAVRMIPSPYLRYFYRTEEVLDEQEAAPRTRAQEVMEIEGQLFDYYRDKANREKPDLLSQRGGAWYSRVALQVMECLLKPNPTREIVNTQNRGAVPGLPDDAVVEVPARLSSYGVEPIPVQPLEEEIGGLVRQVKSYERLTIQAAMERSRDKALAALMANPLVRTLLKARAVLEDLVAIGEFRPMEQGDAPCPSSHSSAARRSGPGPSRPGPSTTTSNAAT